MSSMSQDWAHIRREYESKPLDEAHFKQHALEQFKLWFDAYLAIKPLEPNAMTLSTVDSHGYPDSRVVLLKGIWQNQLVFYSNYRSVKAQQMAQNPKVALNFYWPEMSRQVRMRGVVTKLADAVSDAYFATRPFASQCSARVSPQSQVIPSIQDLQEQLELEMQHFEDQIPPRPAYWGGYAVDVQVYEFWQGRAGRFHDRILYTKNKEEWLKQRLAP